MSSTATPWPDALRNRVTLGLAGLWTALERLNDLRNSSDPLEVGVPAVECTAWAAGLAETLKRPVQTAGLSISPSVQGRLDAICWARHRGLHQLVAAAEERNGAVFPIRYPMRFMHWAWVERSELDIPDAQRSKATDAQEAAYDEHLANTSVHHTLLAAYEDLQGIATELGFRGVP